MSLFALRKNIGIFRVHLSVMEVDVIIALGNVPPEFLVILRQQIVEVIGFLVVFIYPLAERKLVNLFAPAT